MKSNLRVDLWYGDKLSDADSFDFSWSDIDCVYRGNIFIGDMPIGDFTAKSIQFMDDAWQKAHKN